VESRLEEFLNALYAANQTKNLTRVPRDEAMLRHIQDSLLHQDLIPQGAKVLDIGTGPGFPAWPLALTRPDLRVTALDSNGKMLDFLRTQPLKNLDVVQRRAEEWGKRERFDIVTGRAVAPLMIQLELSAAFAKVGGAVIPMRTSADLATLPTDIPELGLHLEDTVVRPLGDFERVFPIYRKIAFTQARFPRKWAEIKNNPLG
jgi:16S rRNA (guanine527-N7)-methyltransferase